MKIIKGIISLALLAFLVVSVANKMKPDPVAKELLLFNNSTILPISQAMSQHTIPKFTTPQQMASYVEKNFVPLCETNIKKIETAQLKTKEVSELRQCYLDAQKQMLVAYKELAKASNANDAKGVSAAGKTMDDAKAKFQHTYKMRDDLVKKHHMDGSKAG